MNTSQWGFIRGSLRRSDFSQRSPHLACSLAVLLGVLLQGAEVLARPAEGLLLRHGHKSGERVNGMNLNTNLSHKGWQQALHLAQIVPACFVQGKRLHLASYRFDLATGKNARSYQTLVPLAVASGASIRVYSDSESASRANGQMILADPANDGALVVIAWEHRHMPELAQGLGWQTLGAIANDDFDSLWLLRYSKAGGPPEVTVLSQTAIEVHRCPPQR